jgi:hypothetical protein
MTLEVGAWVLLHDGRAARIARLVEGPAGQMVEAETVDGQMVDRPESYAMARWRPIEEDGLAVRLALDPEGVRSDVASKPVEVVVAALRDLGRDVNQAELKDALTRDVIPEREFTAWWKRVQPLLSSDERVDAGLARIRRYRLLPPGTTQTEKSMPRVTAELRNGRKLADAPQLKHAREQASNDPSSAADDARPEAALAERADVDPTDRFMAAELGGWIRLWDDHRSIDLLGPDLARVDLLRISQYKSRSTALDWYSRWLEAQTEPKPTSEVPEILQSASALGPPWADVAGKLATRLGIDRQDFVAAALTWSMPGTAEAGPAKIPADLLTYDRRLERVQAMATSGDETDKRGLARGALEALQGFPLVDSTHASVGQVLRNLVKCWLSARRAEPSQTNLADLAALPAPSMTAVFQIAPDGFLSVMRPALEQAYVKDPQAYRVPVEVLAARRSIDPGSIALSAARRAIREGNGPVLVAQALALAKEEVIRVESANLAVAVSSDDRQGLAVLNEAAEKAAAGLLEGSIESAPALLFTQLTWRRFATAMLAELERAHRSENMVLAKVVELEVEVERLKALDEQRRAALSEARAESGARGRASASALAAGALRPVATALADSYEANSLDALRDRLEAVVLRAGMSIVIRSGEMIAFDPTRQRWVGEGDPPETVMALSPALVLRGEGNDEVLVVPARVVAAK